MKYKIELTEYQLGVVLRALDLYSRIGAGQISEVDQVLRALHFRRAYDYNAARDTLYAYKAIIFPELHGDASYGIRSEENVPKPCREAYDMIQSLRFARNEVVKARETDEEKRRWLAMTVDNDPYWATNSEQPQVPVEVIEDDKAKDEA